MTATTFPLPPSKLFINGNWNDSASGKTFSTINPATESEITKLALAEAPDVDAAVRAAHTAFESGPWSKLSATDRGKFLTKIGDAIMAHADEMAYLETIDIGKPISESRNIDVPFVAELFYYYAGWANKYHGETIPVKGNYLNYTLREPLGVVGAITPWNFPILLACWKIAPALAMGNTVIHKPSEQSSLSALKLAEICREVELPEGAYNVVTGGGRVTGSALVAHPGVDKIAFTGGTSTGISIMQEAARTLKRVTLELGGKSPNIVLEDADLDAAVRGALVGIFYNKGEVCAAGSRLFVQESVHDAFMQKLLDKGKKMQVGDPLDPKTRFGPLCSAEQLSKVMSYIGIGKEEGAELAMGGDRAKVGDGKGYFIQPTIFDRVTNSMKIAQEEIFGPVLSAISFKNLDELIAAANDSIYGLASGVWTRDIKKAHYIAKKLKAGTVWINTYNAYDPASPFGGYKQSGFGRELGMHALESYTQVKSVWVDMNL
ncbi:MAG TPA: aldehyde dehydrogenase family protein [Acidobacteriota bacterium]|nr:aldehyde dehydrogenase family protein [Acidobacteriota bacterium]